MNYILVRKIFLKQNNSFTHFDVVYEYDKSFFKCNFLFLALTFGILV